MDKPRVLLIDDDPIILRMLEHELKQNFITTSYSDVLRALPLVKYFDLVISDFSMPSGDGYDVVEAALPYDVPVIIYSGAENIAHKYLVSKHDPIGKLLAIINNVLRDT